MEGIGETINGLQHIGLPTNDLEKTLAYIAEKRGQPR